MYVYLAHGITNIHTVKDIQDHALTKGSDVDNKKLIKKNFETYKT